MLDQAQFMRQFNETHREQFNPDLFKRDNDEIVEAIREVVTSCQRDKYYTLKLLSFTPIYDYERIKADLLYYYGADFNIISLGQVFE